MKANHYLIGLAVLALAQTAHAKCVRGPKNGALICGENFSNGANGSFSGGNYKVVQKLADGSFRTVHFSNGKKSSTNKGVK